MASNGFLTSSFKYNKFFRLARMCQKSLLKFNVDMDLGMFYKIIRTMRGSTIIHGSDSFTLLDRFTSSVNFTVVDVERRMPVQEKKMLIIPSLLSYFYKTGRLKLNSFARSWSAFYTWEATAIDVLVNNEAGGLTISYTTGLNLPTVTWLARPRVPKIIDYPRLLGYHHMFRFNSSWFFSYNSTSYTVLSSMSYNASSVSRTLSILDFLSNRFDNEGLGILYGRSAVVYRSSFFKPWFYTFFLSHGSAFGNLRVRKNFFGNFSSFKFPTPDVWNYLIAALGKVSLDKRVSEKFQDLYRKRFFNYSRWFYPNFLLNQETRYNKNLIYYKSIWARLFFVLKKRFRSWYLTFLKLKKYPTVTTQYSFVFYGDFIRQSLQLGCDFEGLSRLVLGNTFLTNEASFFFNYQKNSILALTKPTILLVKPFFVFLKYTFNLLNNFILPRNHQVAISTIRGLRSLSVLNVFRLLNGVGNYRYFYHYFLKIIKHAFVFYQKTGAGHFLNQIAASLTGSFCYKVSGFIYHLTFNLLAGLNPFGCTCSENKKLMNSTSSRIHSRLKLQTVVGLFINFVRNSSFLSGLVNPNYVSLEKIPFISSFFSKFILRTFSRTYSKHFSPKNRKKRLRRLARRDPIRTVRRFLLKTSITKSRRERILSKLKHRRISDFSIESSLFNNKFSRFFVSSRDNDFLRTFFTNTKFLIKKSQYTANRPVFISIRGHLKTLINSNISYSTNKFPARIQSDLFVKNVISDVSFILSFLNNKNHRTLNNFGFKNKSLYFFSFYRDCPHNNEPRLALLFQQFNSLSGFFFNLPLINKIFKFIRFLSKSCLPSKKLNSLVRFLPPVVAIFNLFLIFHIRFFNLKTNILKYFNLKYSYNVFSFGLLSKTFPADPVLAKVNYQFKYPTNLQLISISSKKLYSLTFGKLIRFHFSIQKTLPDHVSAFLDWITFISCYKILKKKYKGLSRFDFKKLEILQSFLEILCLNKFRSLKLVTQYLTLLMSHEFFLLKLYKFNVKLTRCFSNLKSLSFFSSFNHFVCRCLITKCLVFRQPIYANERFVLLNFLHSKNEISTVFLFFSDLFSRLAKFKNFYELARFSRYRLLIKFLRLFYIRILFFNSISYYRKTNNRRFFLPNKKCSKFLYPKTKQR
jgi:hypothetical protein